MKTGLPARGLLMVILMALIPGLVSPVLAAPFARTLSFTQPDGTEIQLWGEGDEFHAVFETLDGYAVAFNPQTRAYEYAERTADGEDLIPSGLVVGRDRPAKRNLGKHLRISADSRRRKTRDRYLKWEKGLEIEQRWQDLKADRRRLEAAAGSGGGSDPVILSPPSSTTTGTKIGLTLLIDFDDDPATIPQAEIVNFCNSDNYTGYGNNGSVKKYFQDNSNGLLTYSNVVTVYIRIPNSLHPKSWYNDTTKDCGAQGNLLIRDAIAILTNLPNYSTEILPTFNNLTVDANNRVIACNVFYAGGNGGVWMYGLWPHSWSLYNVGAQYLSPGGKRVYRYQITDIGSSLELGTFCHENGHMLCGFPDIYDYGYDSVGGAGNFCLMNSGGHGVNPVQINAYLKRAAGWATTLPLTSTSNLTASLTATPGADFNKFYRYPKPGVATEYFLLENRQKTGRDANISASGIAIWHVDELGDRDNQSLVSNTTHANYELTLIQADNLWHFQNDVNSGDSRDLYYSGNAAAGYSNTFSDTSAPDARWWDGSNSGAHFHGFSASAGTMTFQVGGSLPVAITGHPQLRTNSPGTAASFTVTATGTEPLYYQWQKNAINISQATNATYTIASVTASDAGGYRCRVSNLVNAVTSSVAVLTVLPPAPAAIWASATNATDFTAAWSAVSGATGYQLDVATNAGFSGGGGGAVLLDENFDAWSGTWINGWTHNSGVQYTNGGVADTRSVGMNAANDWIQAPARTNVGSLSFYIRTSSDPGNWTVVVRTSPDGTNWTDRATLVEDGAGGIINNTPLLTNIVVNQSGICHVRWAMTARSADSCYIDNVVITGQDAGPPSYVPGYSNLAVAGTSQSVTGLAPGATYHFRARAVSAGGTSSNSAATNVTTLATAAAPVFGPNPGPLNATVDVAMAFTVAASGVPEPVLALQGTTAAAGYYAFTPDAGLLNYTPAAFETGSQTFTFTASNAAGVATQTVTVVVGIAVAVPPTIDPFPPLSTIPGMTLSHPVTATDPDSLSWTFACTSAVAPATWTFNTNSGAFTFTPTAGQIGTNVFAFKAIDDTALESAWSNLVVIVNSAAEQVAVSFGQTRFVAEEGGATAVIPVNLAYPGTAAVEIRFSGPAPGLAQRGADFNCATTLVLSGTSSSNLYIDLVDDALAEGPESVRLTLHPVPPATAGATTQANLYIRDNDAFAVVAANLTSGPDQTYRDSGNRILEALCPDVVLMQEFSTTNGNSTAAYRAWVDRHFGTNFHYYVETGSGDRIPNGVVSRWPILQSGEWPDTEVGDRDFAWAKIQLPGTNILHAVSVHLKASDGFQSTRTTQARLLTNYVAVNGFLTNGYLVIGGDLNLQDRNETALAVLTARTVTDARQPADQTGDKDTNSGRYSPYDLVLPGSNLNLRHIQDFTFYGHVFTNGMVFDTRKTWAAGLPPPATTNDSNPAALPADTFTNMQHMAVMKVFELDPAAGAGMAPPQAFAAAAAGPGEITLSFTTNAAGNEVVVVGDSDGSFTAPAGTVPAVGAAFAGGTVLYKGGVSPVNHTGLAGCATYYYKCWSVSGTNYSAVGLETNATTPAPAAPALVWASATNATDFTAAWSPVAGATGYRIDVTASSSFTGGGGGSVYLVDFEGVTKASYVPGEVVLGGISWDFNQALIGAVSNSDRFNGLQSARVRSNETVNAGILTMNADTNMGLSSITLWHAKYSNDADTAGRVDYSTNGGLSWRSAGTFDVTSTNLARFESTNLNVTGNVRIRVVKTSGASTRFNIDDLRLYPYGSGGPAPGYVPGYSNLLVEGTTGISVTGLTSGTTYRFRTRAVQGACESGDSPTGQVTTLVVKSDQTITFPGIGSQETTNAVGLAATASSGLPVGFAVASGPATIAGGTNLAFTGAGEVRIVASQAGNANWNPAPAVTNAFAVTKATAAVILGDFAQTYNGTVRNVTATTVPAGLAVGFTYDGSGTAPVNAGSYVVTGIVSDVLYQGSVTGMLVVAKAGQAITFPAISDKRATEEVRLSATASSSLPVMFGVESGPATISGGTNLTFSGTGEVRVVASQGGDGNWNPAPRETNIFNVTKASAQVYLQGLALTFDGSARMVTATTMPAGLTVSITYNGLAAAPTNAGSYVVTGAVSSALYQGVTNGALVVARAPDTITLGATNQTYDGTARAATATSGSGSPVTLTYNGLAAVPTNAGTYAVTGIVDAVNWQGTNIAMLVVAKAAAEVVLANLAQTYDGTDRIATATTTPGGLAVDLTYAGLSWAPTNAGSYAVTGTVNDANYAGATNGQLVVAKAVATVTLENLNHVFNGTPMSATATTAPPGLAVDITYDGAPTAPSTAGSYAVTATVNEANYAGTAAGTLNIANPPTPFEQWLLGRSLSPQDARYAPDADDDFDGATTWEEYLADTDPAWSGSVFVLTGAYEIATTPGDTGQIRLAFPASTARYYQLEYCIDLTNHIIGTSNLGWGVPGMVVTGNAPGTWYGVIRSRLTAP